MKNMYEVVTAKIVEQLESGKGLKAWVKPWVTGGPRNFTSGHEYRGLLNLMLLGFESVAKGYTHQFWASFQQIKRAGGSIKAGERATQIVFSKEIRVETANTVESKSDSDTVMQKYRVFRLCPVFNIAQSDIDPNKYRAKFMPFAESTDEPIETAMQFIAGIDHKVQFGSSEACYSPATDTISMPARDQFASHANLVATYAHELAHWSGATHRLNRLTNARFGSQEYSKEELCAELTSAFLCAEFGIDSDEVQHPAYMQSWLANMQQDPKYIFGVASLSKTACDFLKEKSVA